MRSLDRLTLVLGLAQLAGCGEDPQGPVELIHEQVLTVQIAASPANRSVDLLFVIDDSISMAEEQADLAASFGAFIEVLEAISPNSDYRVAVTTTDGGNPRCPSDTAEHGALVLSPCTHRLADFVVDQGLGEVDVRDVACTDVCSLTDAELEIVPTTTAHDSLAKPRPWLERIGGETNLPPGVSMAEAFACFGPQGIAGCNFAAPLESMVQALDRTADSQDPAYGFFRSDAITLILFVTDGHDCSYAADWANIFAPAGNRVFWSDPDAAAPTPAVCWNAGVECIGDPSHYDSCTAVDKDIDGNTLAFAAGSDQAVLHPVQRYIDRLHGFEALQREIDVQHHVVVAVVGGVANDGSAVYAESEDPEFADAFGIGPGCTGPLGVAAVPPVRLLEVVEAFTPDNAFSICNPAYADALTTIADNFGPQVQPACFPACVEDLDPTTATLEPACRVEQHTPGQANEAIVECQRNPDGSYAIDPLTNDYTMPGPDVTACHAVLTDAGGATSDVTDDLSAECANFSSPAGQGLNVEFKIARRPGFPVAPETRVYASCLLSNTPTLDC